tara:strand:- start:273 stop:1028 length:756 start_codon:yes stop_codon:yes gene_type:complete
MESSLPENSLEIKVSTILAVAALLNDINSENIKSELSKITGGVKDYFKDELVIIDIGQISDRLLLKKINWENLIKIFNAYGLSPVAVKNAPSYLFDKIKSNGLIIDNSNIVKVQKKIQSQPQLELKIDNVNENKIDSKELNRTMVVESPIRGGQQIYAKNSDLVIMAVVNSGAEVIADGNIHVYAPLRGRALAGASGNSSARIFSLAIAAELLSISGIYRTFEDGWPKNFIGRPVQVKLKNENLDISCIHV